MREREVLAAAAAVIATSPWAARRVVTRHELDPARVTVATPGVDPAPLAPGARVERGLLCVGALTPTQGPGPARRGARRGPRPGVDRHAGRPAARPRARRRRPRRDRAARARPVGSGLAGALTGAALDAAYAGADLLVVPSRAETYGMVVTEALARGIPVLVSDAAGCRRRSAATRRAACRGWSSRPVALRTSVPHCTVGWPTRTCGRGSGAPRTGDGACCTDGR